ncbi:MAG TPA: magnesium/cobalt transporter CorA [Gammaproteobacteria bacterium]|nr:magnesium/cobalt transporter CorA [Gammaproteobacteria bacterium]
MLTAFATRDGRLEQVPVNAPEDLSDDAVWLDLVSPTPEERTWVETAYGQGLPRPSDMEEIEASARFYDDDNGVHIHSFFLHDFEDHPRNVSVAFTLNGGRLFTLHEHDLLSFRLFRLRARQQPALTRDATSILLGLFEAKVERLADVLEGVYSELETASQWVLEDSEDDVEGVISQLARQEDINGKARLSLMDKQRALSFLLRAGVLNNDQSQTTREILRDIESLTAHTSFLFDKVNFLMDAALGFINLEQNQIIKIFSIAAVVFLPPTLVASIYGMNFRYMPELHQVWGYPFAILLMVLSGVAPYWFFKRKGWL